MKKTKHPLPETPEFLLIDVGNSRLKWTTAWTNWPTRVTGDVATKEVDAAWLQKLAKKYPDQPTVLSCVVPKLLPLFRRAFAGRLVEVSASLSELGFGFNYPKPAELGADRLAAAVAVQAWSLYPAIIVACGTATAFTVLDGKGRICGGAIAPGMGAQLTALVGATAQLPATDLSEPKSYLGKSTQEAIRTGLILSFRGGVKEIVQQLTEELPGRSKPFIIVSGGNARFLIGDLGFPVKVRPLLVFEGLRIIGSRVFIPV